MEFEDDIEALYATYQSLLPMAEADSARLWQKFRLDWNYNSNRIEGNSLTYGETEALLILGTEPKRIEKDIREMKAHDMGIEYLLSLAEDERPVGETDIRTLNQIILKENYWIKSETADGNVSEKEIVPGTYKKMPNHVRLRGGGIHKFAEPNEVPIRMAATVKRLRGYLKKQDKPLAAFLAELHQYFIQTHPFDDGNGRVVRMLLNYVCLKLGWPPIVIKDKNKKEYLSSLEQWDKGNKADLEDIMKAELIWSLKKSIAAARGEDIEDADDLDKEIDLFVREAERNAYEFVDLRERKIKNANDSFWALAELLDAAFLKFAPLFEVYKSYPQIVSFMDEDFTQKNTDEDGNYRQILILDKWKGEKSHQVKLKTVCVNEYKKDPVIVSELEFWAEYKKSVRSLMGSDKEEQIDRAFTLNEDFSIKIDESILKKHCDRIMKRVLEEIKLF